LIYAWVRFFQADINPILCGMIATGIWELMRALKISN
jgi:hypothetical protein